MVSIYKILLVYKESRKFKSLIDYLKEKQPDYILYETNSGNAAIELVLITEPDVVISDCDLKDISLLEMLKTLKTENRTAHIPVIFITRKKHTAEELEEIFSAGAYDCISSSMEPGEIIARMNIAIRVVKMQHFEIQLRNNELTEKTILLNQYRKLFGDISKKLKTVEMVTGLQQAVSGVIRDIVWNIEKTKMESNPANYEIAMQNEYAGFGTRLKEHYPNLTPTEIKFCILIKLGLNIKDMSSILYQSPKSIKVTRYRIRRKLCLCNETNLQAFLIKIS